MTADLFRTVRTDHGERFLPRTEIRSHFADRADVPRLTGQNGRILGRLRQGPATNDELAAIARKYTGRISEIRDYLLRRAWTVAKRNLGGGLWEYRLERLNDDPQTADGYAGPRTPEVRPTEGGDSLRTQETDLSAPTQEAPDGRGLHGR